MHVEGRLPQDVSIGFGLVTVKAGSHFSSDRADEDGHWRTLHVLTAINGKAMLFKAVGKDTEVTRSEFHYLQPGMTVAQAVALAECPARTAGDESAVLRGGWPVGSYADGGRRGGRVVARSKLLKTDGFEDLLRRGEDFAFRGEQACV